MSVLIFIDTAEDGHVKKASLEVMSYGASLASQMGIAAEAVLLGTVNTNLADLGKYGVKKIYHVKIEALKHFDAQLYTKVISVVAQSRGAKVFGLSENVDGKAIAPSLSVRL